MTKSLKQTIGARVRAARKASGLTQIALAERVSRTEEAISNIERGEALPRLDLLEKFSSILGLPLEDFVRAVGDGESTERTKLETEARVLLGRLDPEHLRIAVRQLEALAPTAK